MIEQIFTFVLGVSVVPFIWGVTVVFKTSRNLKSVQEELPNIYKCIKDYNDELNRIINQSHEEHINLHSESVKYIDSRVDKLDSRIESKFDNLGNSEKDTKLQLSELRQRINNTIELVNDITGLTLKKK